jgi:hypothetical protein
MGKASTVFADRSFTATKPPEWQTTHGMYLAGRAELDGADLIADAMERKWGVGRLRLVVSTELREKFDRQRYLLNQAIWHGDLEAIRREAKRSVAAWTALDRAACASGATPVSPAVWEVALGNGAVAAIVRDVADASLARAEGRQGAIYTLEEIGRLLAGFPALARAKEVWEGAAVVSGRAYPSDPLDAIETTSAPIDDIPF